MAHDPASHRLICPLHEKDGSILCSGRLKRGKGGICTKKAASPALPNMMPKCKLHRDQLEPSGRCEKQLSCGFVCGQLFVWKPHGFRLCLDHSQWPRSSYFFKIPLELRLRIYGYLLPDRPIPVRYCTSRQLTSDYGLVYTALLAVNRQIHDEAIGVLYGNNTFNLQIPGKSIIMCNKNVESSYNQLYLTSGYNPLQDYHSLQDYQMQLMLLEHQRIYTRGLMNVSSESSARGQLAKRKSIIIPVRNTKKSSNMPSFSTWRPPISENYFNLIRSFTIELLFYSTSPQRQMQQMVAIQHVPEAEKKKQFELRLYDHCDSLHRLIARLQHVPNCIAQIQVKIKFGNTYIRNQDDAFSTAKLLLQPLRRLQNIHRLEITSIIFTDSNNKERDLLDPVTFSESSRAETSFEDHVRGWLQDLSASEQSTSESQVFDAYWQLEEMISVIERETRLVSPILGGITDMLHDARVAREAEDLASFLVIWNKVNDIWSQYLASQQTFQHDVTRSISLIKDIIRT